jgi:hypothetical protein
MTREQNIELRLQLLSQPRRSNLADCIFIRDKYEKLREDLVKKKNKMKKISRLVA